MFDKVVFAGGGHRCWWQAGFWDVVTSEIELRPRVIGAVSAGAATACLLHANDSRRALAWTERELAGVRSNVNWLNLLRRGRPLFPHAALYRKALRALLGGEHFRRLMWHAPEIRVLLARLPEGMGPRRAVLRGKIAGQIEKRWRGGLHPGIGERLGFVPEVRRVQDCRSERELVDLLVASSATPPFAPVEAFDGAPCLDGGMIDNVPVTLVDDVPGSTLVLTTRRYKDLAPVFARGDRLYVQPSEPVAASGWDTTSPKRYQKTYALGRQDGERFLQTFALGRHRDPERFVGVFLGDAMATPSIPAAAVPDDPQALPLPEAPSDPAGEAGQAADPAVADGAGAAAGVPVDAVSSAAGAASADVAVVDVAVVDAAAVDAAAADVAAADAAVVDIAAVDVPAAGPAATEPAATEAGTVTGTAAVDPLADEVRHAGPGRRTARLAELRRSRAG